MEHKIGRNIKVLNTCGPGKDWNTSGKGGERKIIYIHIVRKHYAADNVFILPLNPAGNISSSGQAT
jgi:hypothetical protein